MGSRKYSVMDNSYPTNPLPSSTLLMLAASSSSSSSSSLTTERRGEPSRLTGPPPHPFPTPPSLDKDHAPPAPPPAPFSHSPGFVFHPDLLPSPLYAPLPPYTSRPLVGPGGRALRHLGPQEGVKPYHSAFTPATKKKSSGEASACSSSSAYNAIDTEDGQSLTKGLVEKCNLPSTAGVQKERPPSTVSSSGGVTTGDLHCDNGDLLDRGTLDSSEGRMLRKSRKRTLDGPLPCCPVCGLTLRPGDTDSHMALELDRLDRILKGGRKSRDSTPGRKTLTSPPTRKGKDSPSPEAASKARFESYLRIRSNRQSRLNARSRHKKRRGGEDLVCPVCSERMMCTTEELTLHVDLCLKKQTQGEEEEDETLDVEGDGGQFEEYTWAGQTRIRATSMLEGGFAGSGFQTSSRQLSDEEGDLDVDGDDTEQYGKPQFTEADLIPLTSDDFQPDEQHQALTKAVTASVQEAAAPALSSLTGEPTPGTSQTDGLGDGCLLLGDQRPVVAALKARLKELELAKDHRHKCLICLNQYEEPLVSVQCWHVHCGSCWLQTLGAKKLCPQCNMITSMANLRRIYL